MKYRYRSIFLGVFIFSPLLFLGQRTTTDSIPFVRFARILHRTLDIQLAYDSKALAGLYLPFPGTGNNPDSILGSALLGSPFSWKKIGDVYTVFPVVDKRPASSEYTGQILDAGSGESLPFASVTIIYSGKTIAADQNGRFVLFDLPSDTCAIQYQYIGYRSRIFRVSESRSGSGVRVYLKPDLQRLPVAEVVAKESSPIKYEEMSGAYFISNSFPGIHNGAGVLDPMRSLQISPGISASQPLSLGTNVRGASPDQTVVLFDGIPLHQPDHFFGLVSVLNPEIIRGARVKRSTFQASDPDVSAAILEFSGKEGSRFSPKTSLNFGLNTSDIYYSAPLPGGKGSFLLSGRRAMSDLWPELLFNNIYLDMFESASAYSALAPRAIYRSLPRAEFSFYDVVARLTLEPGEKDIVRLTLIKTGDRIASNTELTDDIAGIELLLNDSAQWGTLGVSAHLDHRWNSSNQTNLAFSVADYSSGLVQQDFRKDLRFSIRDSTFIIQDSKLSDLNIKVNHEITLPSQRISAGIWLSSLATSSSLTSVTNRIDSISEQQGNNYAIFLQDIIRLGRSFSASAGLRLSYFDLSGDLRGEPRVYIEWNALPEARFKLSFGRHHQFLRRLRRQELYLGTTDVWQLSNPDGVPLLNSTVVSLMFSGKRNNFSYEAEWYFRETEGELADALTYRGSLGSGNSSGFAEGSGRFTGLDLSLSWTKKGFTAHAAYSLSSSQLRISQFSFGKWSYSPYDIPHQFKALFGWRRAGWDLSVTMVLASGMRHTPALGVYTADLINGESIASVVLGQAFSESLSRHSRIDISAFHDFSPKSTRSFQVGVFVRNAMNKKNERDRRYSVNPITNELIVRKVEDIGIVPGLSIKWMWE